MDPETVAALISAGSKVGMRLFDKWSGQPHDQKAKAFVEEHYDELRGLLSDNCVKILKRLEDGQNRSQDELLMVIYPDHGSLSSSEEKRLSSEFEYRLYFMQLVGVLTRPTREHYITEAGKSFVNRARERRDYFRVLFE